MFIIAQIIIYIEEFVTGLIPRLLKFSFDHIHDYIIRNNYLSW